jgi:tetrahydrodipicolinate N-succinyltransferase
MGLAVGVGDEVGISVWVGEGVMVGVKVVVAIGMGVLVGVRIWFDSQAERNELDRSTKMIANR